jgi:tetratricopeptide (TPR) repeat protein
MDNRTFHLIRDYQKQKPFASFLSGVAGPMGIPMWSFFVNRGQLISSFGVRDKNGQIMEFFPANGAYLHVPRIGFRTFVRIDGTVRELFREDSPDTVLGIRRDQVMIEETDNELGLKVRLTWFTLPNEHVAGLVRKVELTDLKGQKRTVEVVDGLAQMLPSGVEFGAYKAVSNLLQSWMQSEIASDHVFLTLRATTGDSVEVTSIKDGNFFIRSGQEEMYHITDPKLVFSEDTTLQTPYGLRASTYETMKETPQVHVNQVPSAMTHAKITLDGTSTFFGLYGYAKERTDVQALARKVTNSYFEDKEEENFRLHEDLVSPVTTSTGLPAYDTYVRQCYMDNALRGGIPWSVRTKDGNVAYYLYSRKHGDLERDYNFFHLEPGYFSQGNGNFRDVLQNRRNDVFFNPDSGAFNIIQFASLIQADGYNPLSIEGVTFSYHCVHEPDDPGLRSVLSAPFTPGMLARALEKAGMDVMEGIKGILKDSSVNIKARYGEGYWEDHFTYLYDLFDGYLSVFPDKKEEMLFDWKVPYFDSPARVLPRTGKHVIDKNGNIRQFGAVRHISKNGGGWLESDGQRLEANIMGKLFTLILNKAAHLDPLGIGLSYEADKPGWNDAMNGLPGLFGSGVSEMFELRTLTRFALDSARPFKNRSAIVLEETVELAKQFLEIDEEDAFSDWDRRMDALEQYRQAITETKGSVSYGVSECITVLEAIDRRLEKAEAKAKALGTIIPTYLTYEALGHERLLDKDGHDIIGHYGLPTVKVTGFSMRPLPPFLEAPARYLKHSDDIDAARVLHDAIKESGMYDKTLKFYQTSVSLDGESHEIGRIRAFTPGWLERESNFLHMTYKYLLGLFKAGLYKTFFEEIRTNYTCFMDPVRYGRPPFENSSFLAPTSNPDPRKHGQGFVSRLTGSTAEVLSMWRLMFFGDKLFTHENGKFVFTLSPMLDHTFFDASGKASARLFDRVTVEISNPEGFDLYEPGIGITHLVVHDGKGRHTVSGNRIEGDLAKAVREGDVHKIEASVGSTT